jgi:two-component system response regulator FlrC
MVKVIIEQSELTSATELKEILIDRLADVRLTTDDNNPSMSSETNSSERCFICSDKFLKGKGGQQSLIRFAKEFRANSIIVIDQNQENFSIVEDLGGKFVRIAIPDNSLQEKNNAFSCNYGMHLIATIVTKNNQFIAGDKITKKLVALAKRVAQTDVTVFINGPTGTGKEVLSKFIHNKSSRKDQPFVGINCAAIPENMLEAILFGHEKGAFTGASNANKGIFRAADGGTLLLDEISEMPLGLQSKLLRVLQEKCVTPIGSQKEVSVNVRVVATTNRNMATEIREGNFREDLYYRLNVFPLATSNLAERKDDIIPLTTALLYRHCNELRNLPWLDQTAVDTLLKHNWPGNVRELENIVQRALVLCSEQQILSTDIIIDNNPLNSPSFNQIEQNIQQSNLVSGV